MTRFPNTFAETVQNLPSGMTTRADAAIAALARKDFVVVAGLTRPFAKDISGMARQEHIRTFCPKDATEKRFGTEASTETWLKKGGGRAMFLLAQRVGGNGLRLAGYGWTGPETPEDNLVPGGKTTFAVRIGKVGLGKGLSRPFTELIVAGTAALYGGRDIWLETWQSNGNAVTTYGKAGFELVNQRESLRTLPDGTKTPDVRLYMRYPNKLLPQSA